MTSAFRVLSTRTCINHTKDIQDARPGTHHVTRITFFLLTRLVSIFFPSQRRRCCSRSPLLRLPPASVFFANPLLHMGTVSSPPRVEYSAFFGYLSLLVLLGPLDHVEAQCQTSSCSGSGSSMTIDGKYYSCCSANSRMCTSDWCPASCSRNTDALDFQTPSGKAYWQHDGFNRFWKCSDESTCGSTSVQQTPTTSEGNRIQVVNFNENVVGSETYPGHKYYIRTTFTDADGATPSNAAEIKLVTGAANCNTDLSSSTLKSLPATKFYDNLCSGLGYRRSTDVLYGTYKASYGPFYEGDSFCFIITCSASSCPMVTTNLGFYM
jgi:hypothetical protein